jgi:hypothetical protein
VRHKFGRASKAKALHVGSHYPDALCRATAKSIFMQTDAKKFLSWIQSWRHPRKIGAKMITLSPVPLGRLALRKNVENQVAEFQNADKMTEKFDKMPTN